MPDAAIRESLAGCDAEALYYGYDGPANPARARLCAYTQLGPDKIGDPFRGAAILAMIYANGRGVPQNLDLAIKFACSVGWGPSQVKLRVSHLEQLKWEGWTDSDFDLCDDVTPGYMMNWCGADGTPPMFAKFRRQDPIRAITAHWSSRDRQAFETLRTAAYRFFDARVNFEVDQSGTQRLGIQATENYDLENGFASALSQLERAEWPRYSDRHYAVSAKELDTLLRRVTHYPFPQNTFITPAGVRRAQRAWIIYVDAWLQFGMQKYPAVAASSWRTMLNRERIEQLKLLDW